ncbi:MAG TPA: alpha/beta hydrolase [Pyrinomonadaceae bacterium]|nr:alpha/beta hydrolase [Pyrinomonadaceae bacterium]
MKIKACVPVILLVLLMSVGALAQTKNPVGKRGLVKAVKVKGIHYTSTGNAKAKNALVFVHCWTCNSEFWKANVSAFSEYRVITLDLPGHGQSEKPKVDYSMELFAEAVDTVMKHAGVKKAVLVGHSMGAPVIRKYYELYPAKTLGLVIVDGALLPFGPRDQVEKFFEPLFNDYKAGAATFIDGMLQTAHADVRPFVRSSMLATPDHVAQSAMKQMLNDAYATHGKITVPVLAVMAPSPMWPKDMEAQYRATAPNLDYKMFEGVSHFLQLEKPREFNDAVRAFIVKNKLL